MRKSLLQYIVCPTCARSFSLERASIRNNEVIRGLLVCINGHKFPIANSIPRLVPTQAVEKHQTISAFSQKWVRFGSATSSKAWTDFQFKWYLDRFWDGQVSKFKKFLQSKNLILDAGTGMGHSAKWFSSNRKAQVFAIDISEGIDVAYRNYGKTANIHFIQADLTNLPFRKAFFDFISSDQVLHHTSDTEKSFKYLTEFLEIGGNIGIYVYKKKAPIREFSDDFIRGKVTAMSTEEAITFSRAITLLGRNLARLKTNVTISEDIPVLGIKKGRYDLQRFIYYHMLKCFWAENSDYKISLAVNFDWYYPKYAFRHTLDEVTKWFAEQHLKIIHTNEIESGISLMGTNEKR